MSDSRALAATAQAGQHMVNTRAGGRIPNRNPVYSSEAPLSYGQESIWLEEQASRTLDRSSYATTMQTLAEISGIFLALYLGFVSTVAATVYTTVSHEIRTLMLQDKVGNAYVRGVALLTAVTGLLSIGLAAGGSPWVVALPVVAVLTLFAIYAFVRLGQRAFYFFDPSILAGRVEFEFRSWLDKAKGQPGADALSKQFGELVGGGGPISGTAAPDSLVAISGWLDKLGNAVDGADGAPTADDLQGFAAVTAALNAIEPRWKAFEAQAKSKLPAGS